MNAHSDIALEAQSDSADAPFDPDGERTERHMRDLARLTEIGMEMAEITAVQARAQRDLMAGINNPAALTPVGQGDFASAFAKLSRGVRQNIMLEDKLAQALRLVLEDRFTVGRPAGVTE